MPAKPIRIETAGTHTATSTASPGRVDDDIDAILLATGFAEADITALRDAAVI